MNPISVLSKPRLYVWQADARQAGCICNDYSQVLHTSAAKLRPFRLWGQQQQQRGARRVVLCAAACSEAGIQALHFGHDHSNDFYGVLDGVRLAYG